MSGTTHKYLEHFKDLGTPSMKLHHWLRALCLYTSFSHAHYEVMQPVSADERANIVHLLRKNKKKLMARYGDDVTDYYSEDMPCYTIDINNDGIDEYVFLNYQGSGGYLYLQVFAQQGTEIAYVPLTKPLTGLERPFYHPATREEQLFLRAQGKVYITGRHGYYNCHRLLYLWQGDRCHEVCDNNWIAQQRALFQELYDAEYYHDAFHLLHEFEQRYHKQIPAQKRLWLCNDILLAAYRAGSYQTAQKLVTELEAEVAFKKASPALQQAIAYNKNMIQKSLEQFKLQGSRGVYDYDWLAKEYDTSAACLANDKRFHELLGILVPDIPAPGNTDGMWRDLLRMHLGRSGVQPIDKRYSTISGFWSHNAGAVGFIWCDRQEKVSVFATGACDDSTEPLYIGSCSYRMQELPAAFYEALELWKKEHDIRASRILFYDRMGIGVEIKR